MNLEEEAEVSYRPDDANQPAPDALRLAVATAERTLLGRRGVKGVGATKTPGGKDGIVVYVEDESALSRLPAEVNGLPIVGEITGEIRAY